MGPPPSFFQVLDQHRATLLAALRSGGGPPGQGRRLPSRDIYYTDSQLFGNQTVVDSIINDISCMLKVPRRSLHILSTSKGLIAGNLGYIEEDGTKVNCTCGATSMSFEAHNLTVPAIRWLGLLPSDIKRARMSLFGTTSGFGTGGTSMFGSTTTDNHNPMKDIEVTSSPDDSIGCLSFSPPTLPGNFLIAGSWANDVRCWEVQDSGQTIPKAQQMHTGPVLDVCWSDLFAPVKTIHWIKAPNYSCVMTGSWDKTLKVSRLRGWAHCSHLCSYLFYTSARKGHSLARFCFQFWDTRSSNPMMVLQLPERCYCADVIYPMAVVATAERGLIVYQLENQPSEFRRIESPLKHQHRCVAIFKDKQNKPTGFALGSIEGRVAIHYINPPNPAKDNFTFKCHRSNGTNTSAPQDIYAVNGIAFHPVHGTLATVGSDGRFSFWDKDARTKLKTSEQLDQPISACCFNHNGNIFAYASSYDWSKGHEFYNPQKKNYIFLRNAAEELKPRNKK
ncbi:mRNA export factor [Tupaia chinensis]|uniref:DNA topoisomerase (ATP-hydrolyzing) n=1 Tax=Tupaia chinensis TaxID=246437 RepID=L9L960_TUPCH|nr:mRNA export factor [Tupaia chinensis]